MIKESVSRELTRTIAFAVQLHQVCDNSGIRTPGLLSEAFKEDESYKSCSQYGVCVSSYVNELLLTQQGYHDYRTREFFFGLVLFAPFTPLAWLRLLL
jgi:hypothetical protein